MMRNVRIWVWGILLIAMFCVNGCGKAEEPVEILTFHAFHPKYGEREIGIYIDWQNKSEQKNIDGMILEITCNEDLEQTFQCYLLEPEEVLPEAHNQNNIITMPLEDSPDLAVYSLTVSIVQVNYSDGSIWQDDRGSSSFAIEVDGEKGVGVFPARINEAVFFESSAEANPIDPIYFQVDWTNDSKEANIIAVDYQITAKTSDGAVISTQEGENTIYISEYYANVSEWILPELNNKIVTHHIWDYDFQKAVRENGAAVFEIAVCRVVDSQGIVWDNPNKEDKITAVLCGKKGYPFQREISNESVQELIKRIADRAEQYKLDLEEPKVFISEQNYCVLRYENVDIRVELSDTNEVLPDKVAFVYYSKQQLDDMENYVRSCLDQICALRLCICPAVLYDRPYEELMETLEEYNGDHDKYLDCKDPFYGVFGQVINILDEQSEVINCTVIGVGKRLNGLPENFFWVRENPWVVSN